MWLMNANYPVRDCMNHLIIHLFLLIVNRLYHIEILELMPIEWQAFVGVQKMVDYADIAPEITQLFPYRFAY
jgi:hypothetical protein